MNPLRFTVVGIGGYGLFHLEAITWLEEQGLANLVGLVALHRDQAKYSELIKSLKQRNVVIYSDIDEFFSSGCKYTDILTVPIGIHMHAPVSQAALQAGIHVYCEKPLAATVQEVDQLISVQRKSDRKIAIGFQHITSYSMQQLKDRICDGRLGKVKEISVMCGWPRSSQYYSRNDWTGKLRLGDNWILDSPANSGHAHYLLNMLYLCSSEPNKAATPTKVRAELYRANHIPSPDLAQLYFETEEGCKGSAIFSHSNFHVIEPLMRIVCENGDVEWQTDNGKTTIKYKNGKEEEFDNETHEHWRFDGFKNLVQSIHENTNPVCTPEIARCHTVTINAMHESCPKIVQIPEDDIVVVEDWEVFPPNSKGTFRKVKNMDEYLYEAFNRKCFLSELGIPWATSEHSQVFELKDYTCFPENNLQAPRAESKGD